MSDCRYHAYPVTPSAPQTRTRGRARPGRRLQRGTAADELARTYGVSRATVYRIPREHHVKNSPRPPSSTPRTTTTSPRPRPRRGARTEPGPGVLRNLAQPAQGRPAGRRQVTP
ncbi:helix-turn-helix domain-containing protein [Kribbella sp. NPDC003557]|uniref:helix-turn-helix domain-containing protein n=1 Tax=Kribbella sp. NPDC003557 TaxID=3154449 RepID=UPI0033AB66A0